MVFSIAGSTAVRQSRANLHLAQIILPGALDLLHFFVYFIFFCQPAQLTAAAPLVDFVGFLCILQELIDSHCRLVKNFVIRGE